MPKTAEIRHVVDFMTDTALVFPDELSLTCSDRQIIQTDHLVQLTYSVEWRASQDSLSSFKKARQIAFSDSVLSLTRPTLSSVKYFAFSKTGLLMGNLILSVDSGSEKAVIMNLKTEPGFLSPQYRGTTEYLTQEKELAKTQLSVAIQTQVNGLAGSVGTQLSAIIEYVKNTDALDQQFLLPLVDQLIDRYGRIGLETIDGVQRWRFRFISDQAIVGRLTSVQTSNTVISGLGKDMTIVVTECGE